MLPSPNPQKNFSGGQVLLLGMTRKSIRLWLCGSLSGSVLQDSAIYFTNFTLRKDQNVLQRPLYCAITFLILKGQRSKGQGRENRKKN